MKIRNGDTVVVINGKDKGKTGNVLRVLPNKNRVVVADINMRTRHMKATPQQPGQKIVYEASLDVSNVMLIDPKTKKRTRIGFGTDAKGNKVRIAKVSKEVLPSKKATTTAKKTTEKDVPEKDKKSFWQRSKNSVDTGEVAETDQNKDHSVPDQVERKSTRTHSRGS